MLITPAYAPATRTSVAFGVAKLLAVTVTLEPPVARRPFKDVLTAVAEVDALLTVVEPGIVSNRTVPI